VIYTAFDAHSGTVSVDGSVITYGGLEPINDTLGAANRQFVFGAANDSITLTIGASTSTLASPSSESITFRNLRRWIKKGSDRCADSFTQLAPILRASLGDVDQVIVELDLHDAWNLEQLIGQVVVLRFFSGVEDGRALVHRPIDREAANVNILPIDFGFDLNR